MIAVADTSFIVALTIETDRHHEVCRSVYIKASQIFVPQTTLAETAYFLGQALGNRGVLRFLAQLPQGKLDLIALKPEDIIRTKHILERYADSLVDFVDATIAAVAERLNITRILTLDRRDFALIRPKHVVQFEILPEKA